MGWGHGDTERVTCPHRPPSARVWPVALSGDRGDFSELSLGLVRRRRRVRGIKVLALAGLATKQSTRWFQLQHNARRKKVFEPGMEKQMWKEREKGKKEKPSASVRAEESGGEKWQMLKTETKSPWPAQSHCC